MQQIELVKTSELVPYANNAKMHTNTQVEQIAASITEFGFNDPIAVWTNQDGRPEIVEGHGRVLAAERLGILELPVIRLDHLTDEERRAYTHVHNQTTLNSGFDMDILDRDFELLDFDWEKFGFDGTPTDNIEEVEEVDIPDYVETRCKSGDIWQLGDHTLICGSSADHDTMAKFDRADVSLLLTDPPYGVSYTGKTDDELTIQNDDIAGAELQQLLTDAFRESAKIMKEGGVFYAFYAHSSHKEFANALANAGLTLKQQIIWVKSNFTLGRQDYQWQHEPCLYGWKEGATHYFVDSRKESTVVEDDRPNINKLSKEQMRNLLKEIYSDKQSTTIVHENNPLRNAEHPTMKPIKLMARFIANSSKRGDVVLDVFGGSGSTLIACEQMGRTCLMVEIDPIYCDVILARWEELTGKTAAKLNATS